jgi:hypothetical protein
MVALAEGKHPIVAIAAIAKPEAFFADAAPAGPGAGAHPGAARPCWTFPGLRAARRLRSPLGPCWSARKHGGGPWVHDPRALVAVLEQRSEPAFFEALDALIQDRLPAQAGADSAQETIIRPYGYQTA